MPINVIKNRAGEPFNGSDIHLRQGEMDGACGPYCLAMALIALGLADKETLTSGSYHGNTNIARLIKSIENHRGRYFFRNGTEKIDFEMAIKNSFKNGQIDVQYLDESAAGQELRDLIYFSVANQNVRPVIVGISFGASCNWGHWVLAVGLEKKTNDEEYVLLLDPGAAPPRSGECWNAKMKVFGSGGPLPYVVTPNRGKPYRIALIDAVQLS